MSKSGGLGQLFMLGGYDLSGDTAAIDQAAGPRGVFDNKQGINSSAMQRILGRADGRLAWSLHFNDATDAEHDALSTLPTADVIALWAMSSTRGATAATLLGKQINFDWNRSADGDLQGSVEVLANGSPLEWGVMVTAGVETHASATSSTSLDENGVTGSSAEGARAVLQVQDIDSGTPTFVLEDSADDSAWATLISFTAVAAASAPTAERKTVTGNVDRYLRATTTGTFVNADFAIWIQRGTTEDDEDLS
ncbi:MAG: hypothetical protein Q8Q14_03660 [Gemmatimonadales bacterium]|nr:hypothetical protein [Gemmatimonadales bacterium]